MVKNLLLVILGTYLYIIDGFKILNQAYCTYGTLEKKLLDQTQQQCQDACLGDATCIFYEYIPDRLVCKQYSSCMFDGDNPYDSYTLEDNMVLGVKQDQQALVFEFGMGCLEVPIQEFDMFGITNVYDSCKKKCMETIGNGCSHFEIDSTTCFTYESCTVFDSQYNEYNLKPERTIWVLNDVTEAPTMAPTIFEPVLSIDNYGCGETGLETEHRYTSDMSFCVDLCNNNPKCSVYTFSELYEDVNDRMLYSCRTFKYCSRGGQAMVNTTLYIKAEFDAKLYKSDIHKSCIHADIKTSIGWFIDLSLDECFTKCSTDPTCQFWEYGIAGCSMFSSCNPIEKLDSESVLYHKAVVTTLKPTKAPTPAPTTFVSGFLTNTTFYNYKCNEDYFGLVGQNNALDYDSCKQSCESEVSCQYFSIGEDGNGLETCKLFRFCYFDQVDVNNTVYRLDNLKGMEIPNARVASSCLKSESKTLITSSTEDTLEGCIRVCTDDPTCQYFEFGNGCYTFSQCEPLHSFQYGTIVYLREGLGTFRPTVQPTDKPTNAPTFIIGLQGEDSYDGYKCTDPKLAHEPYAMDKIVGTTICKELEECDGFTCGVLKGETEIKCRFYKKCFLQTLTTYSSASSTLKGKLIKYDTECLHDPALEIKGASSGASSGLAKYKSYCMDECQKYGLGYGCNFVSLNRNTGQCDLHYSCDFITDENYSVLLTNKLNDAFEYPFCNNCDCPSSEMIGSYKDSNYNSESCKELCTNTDNCAYFKVFVYTLYSDRADTGCALYKSCDVPVSQQEYFTTQVYYYNQRQTSHPSSSPTIAPSGSPTPLKNPVRILNRPIVLKQLHEQCDDFKNLCDYDLHCYNGICMDKRTFEAIVDFGTQCNVDSDCTVLENCESGICKPIVPISNRDEECPVELSEYTYQLYKERTACHNVEYDNDNNMPFREDRYCDYNCCKTNCDRNPKCQFFVNYKAPWLDFEICQLYEKCQPFTVDRLDTYTIYKKENLVERPEYKIPSSVCSEYSFCEKKCDGNRLHEYFSDCKDAECCQAKCKLFPETECSTVFDINVENNECLVNYCNYDTVGTCQAMKSVVESNLGDPCIYYQDQYYEAVCHNSQCLKNKDGKFTCGGVVKMMLKPNQDTCGEKDHFYYTCKPDHFCFEQKCFDQKTYTLIDGKIKFIEQCGYFEYLKDDDKCQEQYLWKDVIFIVPVIVASFLTFILVRCWMDI